MYPKLGNDTDAALKNIPNIKINYILVTKLCTNQSMYAPLSIQCVVVPFTRVRPLRNWHHPSPRLRVNMY